jgi:hypothetical protein
MAVFRRHNPIHLLGRRFAAADPAVHDPDRRAEAGSSPLALELLASLIHEASNSTQVIVSTQSPLLLNQFEPEQVVVADRQAGASRFQRLNAAALSVWLEEYSLGELLQKNVIEASPRYES